MAPLTDVQILWNQEWFRGAINRCQLRYFGIRNSLVAPLTDVQILWNQEWSRGAVVRCSDTVEWGMVSWSNLTMSRNCEMGNSSWRS